LAIEIGSTENTTKYVFVGGVFKHSIQRWIDFAIEFQFSLPYTLEEKGETFYGCMKFQIIILHIYSVLKSNACATMVKPLDVNLLMRL
jgi:hypothetical protein